MAAQKLILGVDVGGTGTKGGIVDVLSGEMLTERYKYATPRPATPENIAKTIAKLVEYFAWEGPMGVGFPGVIKSGVAMTAANLDPHCVGQNIQQIIAETCQQTVHVLNDADAAGLAEVNFGAGKDVKGLVIMLTVGTGIGSAFFLDGKLMRNSELGHAILPSGIKAEKFASSSAYKNDSLSLEEWALRFNTVLEYIDSLFWPDLFILGGGISKSFDQYKHILTTKTAIRPAELRNHAGSVGAALAAEMSGRNVEC